MCLAVSNAKFDTVLIVLVPSWYNIHGVGLAFR